MEVPLASVSDCKVWSVIQFLSACGATAAEIHRQISVVYGEECRMSKLMVCRWVRDFVGGRIEIHNMARTGRPSDAVNKNSITAVHSLLDGDSRITLAVIQCVLAKQHFIEISMGLLHTIIQDELGLLKLTAR